MKVGDVVREKASGKMGLIVESPKSDSYTGWCMQARIKLDCESFSRWVGVEYLEVISESR